MVRYHAVARFDADEWTIELAKGDRIAGKTVTCIAEASFSKDSIEHMIEDMVVFYFDWNCAPWDLEVTIEWKGEAEHREWLKEWRDRRDKQEGRTPLRPEDPKSNVQIDEEDTDD